MLESYLSRLEANPDQEAIISSGKVWTYEQIVQMIQEARKTIQQWELPSGSVVALIGDYNGASIA